MPDHRAPLDNSDAQRRPKESQSKPSRRATTV
jgi:hypothetical protein